jgi:uncharacterized protein
MRLASFTALLALALAAGVPVALAYSSPGAPSGYVNDFAQVLSSSAKASLESELSAFQKETSNEIVVAIVPTMGGDYIENYAVKLFEEWGIGTKDKDNGVLLLLAIEEREMRIEVGYGLEGALPDSIAQSILNNEMTPLLKAGDYDGAVAAGVHAIEEATKGEYVGTGGSQLTGEDIWGFFIFGLFALQFLAAILGRSRSWWAGGVLGFLGGSVIAWVFISSLIVSGFAVLGLTLFGLLFDYIVSKGYQNAKARGVTPPWWVGGRGGGHGSGFGGFGGGMSGGGGASGRW